ncbi:MAG TPA: hypothetical protein DEA44_16925, partial [Firmicutes bacterium]|nr:hypothetical protein [Bacillota bacterium]
MNSFDEAKKFLEWAKGGGGSKPVTTKKSSYDEADEFIGWAKANGYMPAPKRSTGALARKLRNRFGVAPKTEEKKFDVMRPWEVPRQPAAQLTPTTGGKVSDVTNKTVRGIYGGY